MSMRKTAFDWKVLDAILQCGATKVMAGNIMDCSVDTIERCIDQEHNITFTQYRDRKLDSTKLKLIQTALARATSGKSDTMLIFTLKNLCGWKNEGPDEEMEKLKKDLSEMLTVIAQMREAQEAKAS